MNVCQQKDELGFTLQEMLVAMIIASLLMAFTLSVFTFTRREFVRWHNRTVLMRTTNRILQIMTFDILDAKHMEIVSDSTLFLTTESGAVVLYAHVGQGIQRNHEYLAPGDSMY